MANEEQKATTTPPWAWIKCIRDMTDPLKSSETNIQLPVEICPWLLLSDRKSTMNLTKLKNSRATHILSVHAVPPREERYFQERIEGTGIIHKRVHCDDTEGYDMIGRHWETCLNFLRGVKEGGDGAGAQQQRVIVHCVAGINRSGLIACAGLMVLDRRPLIEVVQHCLDRRGAILWNRSFQRQLCNLAQRENLLGCKPEGYDDEPLVESLPPPPPAHHVLMDQTAKLRLASHLESRLASASASTGSKNPKTDK